MKYGIKNEKILTSEEVLAILHRSAVRYSEYADTTLLFHVSGKENRKVIIFMRSDLESIISCTWQGMKSEIAQCWSNFMKHV